VGSSAFAVANGGGLGQTSASIGTDFYEGHQGFRVASAISPGLVDVGLEADRKTLGFTDVEEVVPHREYIAF
jgi:hypothetical protein